MDDIDRFFATLGETSEGRLPPSRHGTIRFVLHRNGAVDNWLVTFAGGGATAVPDDRPAGCVVNMSGEWFENLLAGRDHTVSMTLRDRAAVEGDLTLFLTFRRLLPPLADTRGPLPEAVAAHAPRPGGGE
ncbi:SCP2 sterol-binding domain-containing protein [Polymorphospora sp. NPDC051019]|uniref:SCP2 sterol-binding domain-containing protein n=1 Tax=Polymorphospora sp. NPDC051019 TaxID=3155725 RepID=UPI003414EF5E